jgi:hypothetical protein
VLRESHRVLQSSGRVAGYVIHTPDDLSAEDQERATEFGPSFVTASASPAELAASVGFEVVYQEDVSADFRTIADSLFKARAEVEGVLRAEEGDDVYEDEQQRRRGMVDGVDAGLLLRSIVVARKR